METMARARVATMRLRKQRQTELLALAGCHGRAAALLEAKPDAPATPALQVLLHLLHSDPQHTCRQDWTCWRDGQTSMC